MGLARRRCAVDPATADVALAADASYIIGKFKPYVAGGYNVDKDKKYDGLEAWRLKAGLEAKLIPRTIFSVEYGSTDLVDPIDGDKGYVTLNTRIDY